MFIARTRPSLLPAADTGGTAAGGTVAGDIVAAGRNRFRHTVKVEAAAPRTASESTSAWGWAAHQHRQAQHTSRSVPRPPLPSLHWHHQYRHGYPNQSVNQKMNQKMFQFCEIK